MVLAISAAYVRFGGLPWMQPAFYGIGAAVVAIIARSAWKLAKMVLGTGYVKWAIFLVLAVSTAITGRELVWLFLLGAWLVIWQKQSEFPSRKLECSSFWQVPEVSCAGKSWNCFGFSPKQEHLSSAAG